MAVPKSTALRLASDAMDMGAVALRGTLSLEHDGQVAVGTRNLTEWLSHYMDQEVIVIIASIDTNVEDEIRQCGVCGRDYRGAECPHCAQVRARLRGR